MCSSQVKHSHTLPLNRIQTITTENERLQQKIAKNMISVIKPQRMKLPKIGKNMKLMEKIYRNPLNTPKPK